MVYRERLTPGPDNIYASPVLADGKIYYVSRKDGTYVVEAEPKFKQLAHNKIEPDKSVFNASPGGQRRATAAALGPLPVLHRQVAVGST